MSDHDWRDEELLPEQTSDDIEEPTSQRRQTMTSSGLREESHHTTARSAVGED